MNSPVPTLTAAGDYDDAATLAACGAWRGITSSGVAYAAAGTGPPLLLFHGGSGSWNHWLGNLAALSERFHVVALDLPGFGLSAAVARDIGNDAYIAHTAEAVLEIAGEAAPIQLCGFSFGSFVALRVAERLGARVGALTLIAPSGFPAPERKLDLYGPRTLERRLGRAPTAAELREMHRGNFSRLMLSHCLDPEDPLVDLHAWNVAHTRYDSRRLSWSGEIGAVYPRVASPTLLVYGERDASHLPSIAVRVEALAELRPESRVLAIPDAGHWVPYEAAEAVNGALIAFHTSQGRT